MLNTNLCLSVGYSKEGTLLSLPLCSSHLEFTLGLFHDSVLKLLSFIKVETLPAFYSLVFCSYLLQSYEYLSGHGMVFPETT